MKTQKSQVIRGLLGLACTAAFAVYAFAFSGDAQASRSAAPQPVSIQMPTALDHMSFERRLAKVTRNDRSAKTCFRGQVMGGSEVHMAMNFAPTNRPATKQNPGLARAHVEPSGGSDKVLVVESREPTVWDVTGSPSTIVVLGKAVLGSHPEGTRVFAPRFASGCQDKSWITAPRKLEFPAQQNLMDSLMEDAKRRFVRRATEVSTRMFNRPYTSWHAQRGEGIVTF